MKQLQIISQTIMLLVLVLEDNNVLESAEDSMLILLSIKNFKHEQ